MYIRILKNFLALHLSDIVVKDSHSKEVSSDSALERCGDLNHPVDHLRSVLFADVMSGKWWHIIVFVLSDEVLVDLCIQSQLKVLTFLRSGLLCWNKRLVSLLLSIDWSCVAGSCNIFDLDDAHWVWAVSKKLFLRCITRSGRHMTLKLPGRSIFDLAGVNDRINAVGPALNAFLSWDVLAMLVFLDYDFRRVSAHFRDWDGCGLSSWFVLRI